ncbi:purine-nucleoside phosphorylase [Pectinatus sottacetonis]|uniref:purine-nucleoside phosphorylase n=1 Tax=Pectinatus sottacetonis TaxID=1002795 RepID=UPI0018C5C732|nr:purine-nucleoside phosphorylase [Pectinatus sottacetonis]
MSTHIEAQKEQIADCVLLPGDPLRAKYIAETFLTDVQCYNKIRNAFGYTGTYKGKRVSVQGTGMGMPSISIYVNELIQEYAVKKLIRVGTCGGMRKDVHVRDVIIAQGTTTDSGMIRNTFGEGIYYAPLADFDLLYKAYEITKKSGIPVKIGNVISEDRFYNDEIDRQKLIDYGVLAVEMEAAALYLLAAKYHVQALAVFTTSNNLVTGEETTAKERERSFNDMIKIALDTATAE